MKTDPATGGSFCGVCARRPPPGRAGECFVLTPATQSQPNHGNKAGSKPKWEHPKSAWQGAGKRPPVSLLRRHRRVPSTVPLPLQGPQNVPSGPSGGEHTSRLAGCCPGAQSPRASPGGWRGHVTPTALWGVDLLSRGVVQPTRCLAHCSAGRGNRGWRAEQGQMREPAEGAEEERGDGGRGGRWLHRSRGPVGSSFPGTQSDPCLQISS